MCERALFTKPTTTLGLVEQAFWRVPFCTKCQTIECNLSIRFCVILCERLGQEMILSSVMVAERKTRLRFWCLQSMSVVDTRLLGRPSTFGGAEAEWPDWAFSTRAYGAAIDAAFPGAMDASRATAPVFVTTLGGPEQNVTGQLFFMLAMMTKGPALAIVRQAEISGGGPNGLEAWRLLVRRYEPEASTRTLGLLQQILNPVPFPDNVTGFEEALSKWELTISRWESSAHDALNEGVKIALLLKMTPEPLRQNLHLQGHTKYGVARAAVVNALLSQHSWQNAPEPMEVGEIGGKRPHKGKAKGKRKQKQKQQSKQQDKDYSDYQCHNCGKMGHISSQCWSKSRKGKGKGQRQDSVSRSGINISQQCL